MKLIIKESYRVLDNHRPFVFNVGDIFDNDHRHTRSSWGKRRIPLGAYFTRIFEEVGFQFVDDFIWDKGEVESQRHKNANNPYPLYQYPINCYEHIFVFYRHRLDDYLYPCPIYECLKVNGNAHRIRKYSFHPKIRYHLTDGRVFYAWIQVFNQQDEEEKFDNLNLPTYQVHDNQKTQLRILDNVEVLYRGDYDYSVFQEALNNFEILDDLQEDEKNWKK